MRSIKVTCKDAPKAISELESSLQWPITVSRGNQNVLCITSDPVKKSHTINFPPKRITHHNPVLDVDFLHELSHAYLGENVHFQFATTIYHLSLTPLLQPIYPAIQSSLDWFVEDVVYSRCKDGFLAQLHKDTASLRRPKIIGFDSMDRPWISALILAQSIQYLNHKPTLVGWTKNAVERFLDVPPDKPTIENLEALNNSLISLTNKDLKIRLVDDGRLEVWTPMKGEGNSVCTE